jgi:hypothetical protein
VHDMNETTIIMGSDGTASASVLGRGIISSLFSSAATAMAMYVVDASVDV